MRQNSSGKKIVLPIIVLAVLICAAIGAYYYFHAPDIVKSCIYLEAGDAVPSKNDFLKEPIKDEIIITPSLENIDTTKMASYSLDIKVGRFDYVSSLVIVDSISPVAQTKPVTLFYGETCEAMDFLENIIEVTKVHAQFETAPDFTLAGEQPVKIKLLDLAANFNEYESVLTIIKDETAPVISGVEEISILVGEAIAYKDGVSVTDDYDPEPVLEIDNSAVDVNTPGEYDVIYKATDFAGNTSQVITQVTVKAPDPGIENEEEMLRLTQIACAEAYDVSESDYEKLYNIYWWIKNNTKYTGYSNKESAINEAISGFTTHTGDCFTYYAMLKAMMEYAGFETMSVTRINGEAQHFWCLVKYKGEWYHIDACPRSVDHMKYWYCFLRTDAEVEALNRAIGENYYYYDKTLVPASGTTIWDIDWRGTL